MKQASLLLVFCIVMGLSATAQTAVQSTATADKKTQRITIVTQTVDDQGQSVTQTYIAEGEKPEEILSKMVIDPAVMQQVEFDATSEQAEGERLFLFRSAGDNVVIEGKLDEDALAIEADKIVVISREAGTGLTECKKIMTVSTDRPSPEWHVRRNSHGEKSNCAALGVFVGNGLEDTWGARINTVIEKGGAQEAGLKAGDIIKNIDEFDVNDYPSLHFALSHFRAGDKVAVRFERDGKGQYATVELKGWDQIPGHEFRARTDCANEITEAPKDDDTPPADDPDVLSAIPEILPLELEDASIYPNPTEGEFGLSFKANPGPITISIADNNGKTMYTENNKNFNGSYSNNINIRDYPQGNYIISVKQGGKVYTRLLSKV